jgi:hypothetical protein
MPRFTVKIKDRYFHWSTVVDAPITDGLTLEEFRRWYIKEYGRNGYEKEMFDRMIQRLEKYPAVNGSGIVIAETLREALRGNRAGKNENHLTSKQIYEQYRKK